MPNQNLAENWDKIFDGLKDSYQLTGGLQFLRKFIRSPFIQTIARYAQLGADARILEAGCGGAKFSLSFALMGYKVTALDFSQNILDTVNQSYLQIEKATGPLNFSTYKDDLEQLSLPDNIFDLVMNEGVVEHWLDDTARRRVLAHMARVTKPGGTVAVIIPNGNHPWVDFWITKNPAFLAAPPMIKYTPARLRADLGAVGLQAIQTDGLYAWRSIDDWPRQHRFFQVLGGALQRLVPLPHAVRERWGLHLIGLGRKPA